MLEMEDIIHNIHQEMKRGTLVLLVLTQLSEPQYGYSLIQSLKNKGVDVDQNTIYPLLRRLEKQKLLEAVWKVNGNRPRKYYKISELGRNVKNRLIKDWIELQNTMSTIIGGDI